MNPSYDSKKMIACNFFFLFEKIYWKVAVWQVKGSAFRLPGWTVLCRIIGIFVHTRISIQSRQYVGISISRTSTQTGRYSAMVILYL